jgi:hypothetical protein
MFAGTLLVLVCGCSSSAPSSTDAHSERAGVRPPTARERAQITASVKDLWLYESERPHTIDDYFRGVPRRPPLQPLVVKARILSANPRYASVVVALRDARGKMHDTPWIIVLQGGSSYTPGGWAPVAGPALDFPLSCTITTPSSVRALMCPNPWSVVAYPRPRVFEQTALTQRIASPDLHRIDWRKVVLPGGVCGSSQPIRRRTHYGEAYVHADVNLPWWNPVAVSSWGRPVFGDLDGDGRDEAALHVNCDNGGGTAAGQLQFSDAVFEAHGRTLRLIGIVKLQQPLDLRAGHVPVGFVHRIERGRITTHEAWYGPYDGTCCGSGRVGTTWDYRAGRLAPRRIRVIKPIWTSPVQVVDMLAEPGDRALAEEAEERRVKVVLMPSLHFDVGFENLSVATKRNVRVTLTIPQSPAPIVRTLTVRRLPYSIGEAILRFDKLAAVKPGRTSIVIQIHLPGATPLRYPVTFARG